MKKTIFSILFSIILISSYSQINITSLALNTGGSFFEKGDYMISSNIGEMSMVNSFFTSDFIITNGVLQPLVAKKTETTTINSRSLRIYPTIATSNFVYLESSLQDFSICKMKVYNSIGQISIEKTFLLQDQKQVSKIELNGTGTGNYFIEVNLYNKEGVRYCNQVFKIQKM